MRQKLSLEIETLCELTPGEARAINGGAFAQPTTTVLHTRPIPTPPIRPTTTVLRTPPVAQPTTTVRMTPPVRI